MLWLRRSSRFSSHTIPTTTSPPIRRRPSPRTAPAGVRAGCSATQPVGNSVPCPSASQAAIGDPAEDWDQIAIVEYPNVDAFLRQFDERYNSDLANDLGNLLNRTLSMSRKYRDGVVGGSSAGATIQGSYLARGDTRTKATFSPESAAVMNGNAMPYEPL